MALVELHRFYNPVEAELARLRLGSEGIDAIVFDTEMAYVTAATGIRLMVADDDEAAARDVLGLPSAPEPR